MSTKTTTTTSSSTKKKTKKTAGNNAPQGKKLVSMHLSILTPPLHIAFLPKDKIAERAYDLVRLIFFPKDPARFFSFTEREEEISLIITNDELQQLSPQFRESLTLTPHRWKALQVSEGSLGFANTGIVHSLASPLAQAGITIFYISTYLTDFVLVQEHALQRTIDCLKTKFHISTQGEINVGPAPEGTNTTPSESKSTPTANDTPTTLEPSSPMQAPRSPRLSNPSRSSPTKLHPLLVHKSQLFLCSLTKENKDAAGLSLLKVALYREQSEETKQRIFSLTETEDELSLIVDKEGLDALPIEQFEVMPQPWHAIQVADGPLGFEETGVVNSLASPLSASKVSVFYLSSYLTDTCMVEADKLENAVQCLQEKGFEIRRS